MTPAPERVEHLQRPDGCVIEWRLYNPDARHTVVLSNGLGCGEVFWRHLIHELASDHRVITWDYRGSGRSSEASGAGAYSARAHAADLAALQDAAGIATAVHVGFGIGTLIVLEHHGWASERIEALVLIQGGLSLREGDLPWAARLWRQLLGAAAPLAPLGASLLAGRSRALTRAHELARRTGIIGRTFDLQGFSEVLETLAEQSVKSQIATVRALSRHRPAEALSEVKVPTLVIGSDRDPLCPEPLIRQVHESLHNSEYVVLPGASHACTIELGPVLAARVRRFIEERRSQRPWKRAPVDEG